MEQTDKVDLKSGDEVGWQWGNGIAMGEVISIHYERTEITSKGTRIVRNGTHENPAVLIKHKSGNNVLKLQSELQLLGRK